MTYLRRNRFDLACCLVTVAVCLAYFFALGHALCQPRAPQVLLVGHWYCCLGDERMRDLGVGAAGSGGVAGVPAAP